MINKPKYIGTPEYDSVYKQLKLLAIKKGKPTGYNFIFRALKLFPGDHAAKEAGQLLGEISERMHLEGKPMLSGLVINQTLGMPGNGFFELAVLLGRFPANSSSQDKKLFWKNELAKIYSTKW